MARLVGPRPARHAPQGDSMSAAAKPKEAGSDRSGAPPAGKRPPPALQARPVAPRTPVTQHVLTLLQERIVSGQWPSGFRLESQRELAEQLGVSRASLREAISSLEAFGLVSVEPGRGVFVTSADQRQRALQASSAAGEAYSDEELYEARLLMEGWAAALAALSITGEQLEALRALVDQMQAALAHQDQAALDHLDFEFHAAIVSACRNRLLRKLLTPIFSEHDMSNARIADAAFISTRVKEHRDVLNALASREPARARDAMRTHILRSAKRAQVKLTPGLDKLLP
ncbi:MAG: FadR/GntR family transcriptional regulator [Rubrivivax sp.]